MLRKSRFAIDDIHDDDESIEGYTDDSTWNGWANVYLTLESLKEFWDNSPYSYTVKGDKMTVYLAKNRSEETFKPIIIDGLKLYDMNGYCFVEVENA